MQDLRDPPHQKTFPKIYSAFRFSVTPVTERGCDLRHPRLNHSTEDNMVNQFQESLMDGARSTRPAFIQMAIGLLLVVAIAAFGIFAASYARSEEALAHQGKPATAKVLPDLVIWPESLEPNLSDMLATGDGGATIDRKDKTKTDPTHR
jgi:hypothetical protein